MGNMCNRSTLCFLAVCLVLFLAQDITPHTPYKGGSFELTGLLGAFESSGQYMLYICRLMAQTKSSLVLFLMIYFKT